MQRFQHVPEHFQTVRPFIVIAAVAGGVILCPTHALWYNVIHLHIPVLYLFAAVGASTAVLFVYLHPFSFAHSPTSALWQ
jgi:hypothetical protein